MEKRIPVTASTPGRFFAQLVNYLTSWAAKNVRDPLSPSTSGRGDAQMRTFIGPAVLVAIGLMWSVAAMSKLVPVPSEDLKTAATSLDVVTVGQGKSASAE
jgi:hypothetical protein